ncbi:MAG: BatA domain-containing protein [Planctomycetota bacterium]|jgi:hypothetical protein|nr:BatA domain-containing protein [Planctomycetota bacterium]
MSLLFLTPAILGGLLALGIPVLLHLRPRSKMRRIPFAAMRFLQPAMRRSSRRLRIQNILLLLVRLAVLLLVVMALARPVLKKTGGAVGEIDGPTDMVVVLDASMSMQCRDGHLSRFERGKARVDEILQVLDESDSAGLVVAGENIDVPEELTPEIEQIRERLATTRPSLSRASMPEAISVALQMLQKSQTANREICVVSDRQQASWQGDVKELDLPDFKDRLNIYVIDVGGVTSEDAEEAGERRGNLAIIRTEAPSEVKSRGRPVAFTAEIQNFGEADADVIVRLAIDGKYQAEKPLTVPFGGSAKVTIHHPLEQAGMRQGFFQLDGDPLEADDRRHFAVTVHDGVPVLVVDGAPSEITFRSETYFLSSALSPGGSESALSPFIPKVIKSGQISSEDLSRYEAVILANVAKLQANDVSKLQSHVNAGGRMLIFPGDRTDIPWHNQALASGEGGLLPAGFGKPAGEASDAESALKLTQWDNQHPIFKPFDGEKAGDLSHFRFHRVHTLLNEGRSDSRVLASFDNGSPALIEANRGLGKVLVAAFPVDADWGNLPLKTSFVPFIHHVTQFLTGGTHFGRNYIVGESIPFALDLADFGTRIAVKTPSGIEHKLKGVLQGNMVVAHFNETSEPGTYVAQFSGTEREKFSQFAVNVDTKESDLSQTSNAVLRKVLKGVPLSIVQESQPVAAFLLKERRGIRLSLPLLYAAFALYLIESFLSGRFAPQPETIRNEEDQVGKFAGVSVRVGQDAEPAPAH